MPFTIVATFECATIDEFTECLAIIRDNEPSSLSFDGSVTFIPEADLTPPHGIRRSEAFAKASEAAQRHEQTQQQSLTWDECTTAIYSAAEVLAVRVGHRGQFLAIMDELGRDAWGSTTVKS